MSSCSEILCLLNANNSASCALCIFAITFFLSTSCIEVIWMFCFSRNSSISFRKVLWVAGCSDFLKIGSIGLVLGSWLLVVSSVGTVVFFSGSSVSSSGSSSSVVNAYFHIILSCSLNGIAKSLMFRSATLIAGSWPSSVSVLFSLSLR